MNKLTLEGYEDAKHLISSDTRYPKPLRDWLLQELDERYEQDNPLPSPPPPPKKVDYIANIAEQWGLGYATTEMVMDAFVGTGNPDFYEYMRDALGENWDIARGFLFAKEDIKNVNIWLG